MTPENPMIKRVKHQFVLIVCHLAFGHFNLSLFNIEKKKIMNF